MKRDINFDFPCWKAGMFSLLYLVLLTPFFFRGLDLRLGSSWPSFCLLFPCHKKQHFLVFLWNILLTHSFWLSGHRAMRGGWEWRKKGAGLQAGNWILEEKSFKQAIHGIFPSPQVSGLHLNWKQGNKDKCHVGLPLEGRAPGWSRWKESVSNALESIVVHKGIPGPSLHIFSGYFHLFPSRAFEFHKLVSKISVPPRIWQRKARKVQPERLLSSNSALFILKKQIKHRHVALRSPSVLPWLEERTHPPRPPLQLLEPVLSPRVYFSPWLWFVL